MARNTGRNGFADAPLAWMIGQLQHHLHLRFDEGELHERFPSYPESGPLPRWIRQDVKVFNAFKMFCHGWNQRTPGRYGDRTFEEAHITMRLRGFGRNKADLVMIPGYQAVDIAGKWVWFRLPSWRSKFLRWITNIKYL